MYKLSLWRSGVRIVNAWLRSCYRAHLDRGGDLTYMPPGKTYFKTGPARFLYSVGKLQFFEAVSGVLLCGDMALLC